MQILNVAVNMCRTDRCPCCPDFKHFCIAFRGRKIIATGFNCRCRIPKRIAGRTRSNHAETATIFKVRNQTKSFDLLVIRLNNAGDKLLISKPCHVCAEWINRYPINRIFYSDEDGAIVSSLVRNFVPDR